MQQIRKEDLGNMTPEQLDIYLTALAKVQQKEGRTQKAQVFAQGATFGFADEVQAGLYSLLGPKTYRENVEEIRKAISQYREDAPVESTVYEIAGAIAPAVLSRGKTAPLSMAQIATRAAGEGALSGYGTSEGDILQQLTQTASGMATGAGAGTAMAYGMKGLGALTDKLVDSLRRLTGGRGASVVENEILRLSNQTGETPDEIVARIARGEIMADNKSVHMALRDLMSQGGIPESTIRQRLPERAESLRLEAQAGLKQGLSPDSGSNVLKAVRMKEEQFKAAESDAYNRIFSQKQEVPELQDMMLEAINRLPNAKDVISTRYKTAGNLVPPFKIGDNGAVEWTRIPTLEDAEILRRTLDKEAGKLFRSGDGDVGENLMKVERQIRGGIDDASTELAETRASWARMSKLRNKFEDGRKAFSIPPEQLDIDFGNIADDPELVAAFREGVMAQINNKLARVGGKQLMKKLVDTNTAEGKLFDMVFPEDMKRQALNKMLASSAAQTTYEKVIEGSSTFLGQQASKQANRGIGLDEMMGAARLNPLDIARVGAKLVNSLAPELSESQRKQIVDVLISNEPDIVRNALTDTSAMARLQNQINLMSRRLQATARTTGAISGGTLGSTLSGQYFEE